MQADLIQYQFMIEANLQKKKKKSAKKKRRRRSPSEENKSPITEASRGRSAAKSAALDFEDDVMESSFLSTPFKKP